MTTDWQTQFRAVWDRGMAAWQAGRKSAKSMFNAEDAAFLSTLGCTPQELFDFVDDQQRYGEPDFETTLAVAAVRREYFLNVMNGKPTGRTISMDDLPAKTAQVDGIPWLPRLIEKARSKLRGEMPDDLMYGCGGDRQCFREINMSAPNFLRLVWECGNDTRRIVDAVKRSAGRK